MNNTNLQYFSYTVGLGLNLGPMDQIDYSFFTVISISRGMCITKTGGYFDTAYTYCSSGAVSAVSPLLTVVMTPPGTSTGTSTSLIPISSSLLFLQQKKARQLRQQVFQRVLLQLPIASEAAFQENLAVEK